MLRGGLLVTPWGTQRKATWSHFMELLCPRIQHRRRQFLFDFAICSVAKCTASLRRENVPAALSRPVFVCGRRGQVVLRYIQTDRI